MQYCANHSDRKAIAVCHGCGKPYCDTCLDVEGDYYYCRIASCQGLRGVEPLTLPAVVECPNCNSEIELTDVERRTKEFHCPECEAFLDYNANPPRIIETKKYSRLFSTRNVGDFLVLKSLLDDSEIDYYVTGEYFMATYPMVEPVRIYVPTDELDKGRELLDRFYRSAGSAGEEDSSPSKD